ncbi:hypothetical protein IAD21_03413 [Abditibacteriota bacterium]|nr:hypothetical protein IAD21_03413 [Abditibacteriota bacterium]
MRRAFTLVEALVVVAIIVILAAILFPVFARCRCYARSCLGNQRQIGLAFSQYTQDFDGQLPLVASRSFGWADLLQPYAKSWATWDCPRTPASPPGTTDYFFNGRLTHFPLRRVVLPKKTLLLGEGDDARPSKAELRCLPSIALEDKKSPAWRHDGIAAYLFCDGHAEYINPEDFGAKVKWNPRHLSP